MSKNTIAVVQLSPGEVGYYDELSRIHLTIGHPAEAVEAGTNCTQLRRSVKSGRLRLVSGSLGAEVPPFKFVRDGGRYVLTKNDETAPSIVVAKPKEAAAEVKVAAEENKAAEAKAEEVKEKPATKAKKTKKEEVVEAAAEEAVAEEPKKATKKTSKKAKKEDAEAKAAE
jgi:hypothetical protein